MEPWNDRNILPPPQHTFRCTYNVDKKGLKYTCQEILRVLKNQYPLHQEGAIMSRFVYKFDKKFRNDIGFRKFKKVNTCLRRYLELNLVKDVEQFDSFINDDDYLPTRQMLQYVLIRLISFAMLNSKIYVTAKQAAVFYLDRIKRGESHWMSLMPYAVLCRIWSISSVLLQHTCKWYQNLYPFVDSLELKGMPFLKEYKIPKSLSDYINMNEIDETGRFNWSVTKFVNVVPILTEEEDNESFDFFKYVQNLNKIETNTEVVKMEIDDILGTENAKNADESIDTESPIQTSTQDIGEPVGRGSQVQTSTQDIGEPIGRESLIQTSTQDIGEPVGRESLVQKSTQNIGEPVSKGNLLQKATLKPYTKSQISHHDICSVTNVQSLKAFLKNEDNYRNDNDKHSLTNHLSFMQWQALKQNLLNLHQLNNKKMCKKLKTIWREKCLDYL